KDSTRSRIPRLMVQPFCAKDSQISKFPLSEDESNDVSRNQNRTISPNSFSSDDTGCPSSQCPSPAKIRSASDNSSLGSPILVKSKTKVKRVRVNVVAESNDITRKHNREQHQSSIRHRGDSVATMIKPCLCGSLKRVEHCFAGSEVDFSSSSSTGSLKNRGIMANNSTGKKGCLSHSRVPHIRSQPVFKPPGSPTAPRDSDLYAPYRTPPKKNPSSCTSRSSSPIVRRTTPGSYHSCGDNHGIRPPNPEQYLTPLQQKEVTIRHLRTKLRDFEQTVSGRESEIQDLKNQLSRMREDWIEEECHRVEAQLALKEARKEIKQLRQVVETMKDSLMEKDKGIQKYFIDINIQNRKLESLLHSMELAQSGATLHDEPTLDFICDSPEKLSEKKQIKKLQAEDYAQEEMTDSGLLVNEEMANQMDMLEQVLMSTAVDCSQNGSAKYMNPPGLSTLTQSAAEDSMKSSKDQIHSQTTADEQHVSGEKAVQTDESFYNPDFQALFFHLLKLQNSGLSSNVLQMFFKTQESHLPQEEKLIKTKLSQAQNPNLIEGINHIPYNRSLSALLIPQDPGGSETEVDPGFIEELDFGMKDTCGSSTSTAVVGKNHWSNTYFVDLVAVAAPVLPTVAWLCSQHNEIDGAPVYSIAALIRGCCIMGLHSLRLVTYGP
ncbi:syntabulin, partial [Silurus meridionalis]